jgi:hypothetical protein
VIASRGAYFGALALGGALTPIFSAQHDRSQVARATY